MSFITQHKWRPRTSERFGVVAVLMIEIALRASDGKYVAFPFQFDTGAIVSLLPRSHAQILGLTYETAERVELGAVGGGTTVGYLHRLSARIGSDTYITLPVVIAESENVPRLIGRLGFLSEFRVMLDPTTQSTRLEMP